MASLFVYNGTMSKFLISAIALLLLLGFFGESAYAEFEHTLIRRVAVFPIAENNSQMSEDAWWQIRDLLTKDQKFLVASRRLMINRGVFQGRKSLKPADAIILAKILDAQALVSTWVADRTMKMRVYDGENGFLFWEGEVEFHPAIPINDQLIKVSLRLMNDFLMAIPYQGFQVTDEVIGKTLYERDSKRFAQVFTGPNSRLKVGDSVQWLTVTGDISQAFLNGAPRITIIAEGVVVSLKNDRAEVEVLKMRDPADLKENALVRFPKELARLQEMYAKEDKTASLSSEYLSSEIRNSSEFNKETNPTVTALAFIANIAGLILLAF
jgi:hypothetical protein